MRLSVLLLGPLFLACRGAVGVVDHDGDGFVEADDCDDLDPEVHPGAPELCDGVDQDCDGGIDDDAVDAGTFWDDADGDGYGAGEPVRRCRGSAIQVERGGDCDDRDGGVHPGATERCDDRDHDCDGDPHTGAADAVAVFYDADDDGFAGTVLTHECAPGEDAVLVPEDCDDSDPTIHPGALEQCDQVDQDCDGRLGFDQIVGRSSSSVAAAIEAVEQRGTICILDGTWEVRPRETLDADLSLVGESREGTTLVAGGEPWLLAEGGALALSDVTVRGFQGSGRLLQTFRGHVSLQRVTVDGVEGGGVVSGLIAHVDSGTALVEDVRLVDLSLADADATRGLAVFARDSTVEIRQLSAESAVLPAFEPTTPTKETGLIELVGSVAEVEDVHVRGVRAGRVVGLLLYMTSSRASVAGVELSDVEVEGPSAPAVYQVGGRLELTDVVVEDVLGPVGPVSLVQVHDGDLGISGARVRGLDLGPTSSGRLHPRGWIVDASGLSQVEVTHLDVRDSHGHGPVISASQLGGSLRVENVVSADNTHTRFLETWRSEPASAVWIHNGSFVGDSILEDDGTSFALIDGGAARLRNLYLGSSYQGDDVTVIRAGSGDLGVDHVFAASDRGTLVETWSGTSTITGTREGVSADFVSVSGSDPLTWDLHLQPTSPLVDAGSLLLLDADGSRSDVGAYGGPESDGW